MAKQTSTPTIEKDGFVLYRDMVSIANEALPDYHDKGKLFALITQFVNQQPLEDAPERVEMAFKFLKNGIEKNSAKYARKKAAMQAYYEERNKEKSAKSEKEDKSAKSKPAAKNTINNSISTSDSYSNSDSNSDSHSDSDSDSNSKQGIINDTIKENINKNYFSNNLKYGRIEEVKKYLEEREIFMKSNWLRDFFHLNTETYHWKFDPYSAAMAFIKIHPEARDVKKKEAPQVPAPPTPQIEAAYAELDANAYRTACEWWSSIYQTISAKLSKEDVEFLRNKVRPKIGYKTGIKSKVLKITVLTADIKKDAKQLRDRIDKMLVDAGAGDWLTKNNCKLGYEVTQEGDNG